MANPLKVEIWSDVICPWCYIGKRRLERALERFEHRDDVEVAFRSFELNPQAERDEGTDLATRLSRKYGVSLEEARAMNQRVTDNAAGEGLEYRLDIARPGNTFDAHRLLHLAAEEGRQSELKERLMKAYFTEGRPIGDPVALAELAGDVGIDQARTRDVLPGDEFADAVRQDERQAAELGISGVPFFVLNRRFGISGAQPAELLAGALQHAWADRETAGATPA
jgi:predicted DsbA family dithiol-disulfide isomerase